MLERATFKTPYVYVLDGGLGQQIASSLLFAGKKSLLTSCKVVQGTCNSLIVHGLIVPAVLLSMDDIFQGEGRTGGEETTVGPWGEAR